MKNKKKVIYLIIFVIITLSSIYAIPKLHSIFRFPQIINTEYFEDNKATISRTSVLKGVPHTYVYTECGEVYITETKYYKEYYDRNGTPVIARFKRDFYDDGMVHLSLYDIKNIKEEGE